MPPRRAATVDHIRFRGTTYRGERRKDPTRLERRTTTTTTTSTPPPLKRRLP